MKIERRCFRHFETSKCICYQQARALEVAVEIERSLMAECEKMIKENDKVSHLQSVNVTFNREVTT